MTRRLDSLKLDTKLLVGFGFLLALILLIGFRAMQSQRIIHREAERIYREELRGISHLKQANINLVNIGRSLRHAILAPTQDARQASLARIGQDRKSVV